MMAVLSRFTQIVNLARVTIISLGTFFLLFSLDAIAQEHVGSHSQPLTATKDATDWTTQNNEVPVCWETPGYDREKDIVKNAVSSG